MRKIHSKFSFVLFFLNFVILGAASIKVEQVESINYARNVPLNIGEFHIYNKIEIESQNYIDKYFEWQFVEVNFTHWQTNFTINPTLWGNVKYCGSLPIKERTICWQEIKNNYFQEYNLTQLISHLGQMLLGDYPLQNLTKNIQFSNFQFNITEGKASFYIIFPEGFRGGERASFGFNSTRILTVKKYDKIQSREKEPFKIYQIDSFELKMDNDSYKRYDYYTLTVNFETVPEDKIIHYYGGFFNLKTKDFSYFFVTNTTKVEKGFNSLTFHYPIYFLEPGEYQIIAFYYFEGECEHYYVESSIFKVIE
ncbi:MAG: hypothetical protein QXP77_00480 [Candidatus Aenigmatarchaeota archaeon]